MDSGTGWTAVIVALLALLGTAYTAHQSRAAGRETARRDDFQLLYDRQDRERERREEEVTQMRTEMRGMQRSQRLIASYVRDLREAIRRLGGEPPPPPAGLDLSPWDELD
ncbi:hypothetical protein ACIO6U_03660 [Streptomyces sp. NPDC087422]|uniref:hypothetical protein n=1 Tax=Streptomyces sp. NPDC087422 TaxID=3365786 RepID=UPI0038238978